MPWASSAPWDNAGTVTPSMQGSPVGHAQPVTLPLLAPIVLPDHDGSQSGQHHAGPSHGAHSAWFGVFQPVGHEHRSPPGSVRLLPDDPPPGSASSTAAVVGSVSSTAAVVAAPATNTQVQVLL